jgi:serine/threonine protein kinase
MIGQKIDNAFTIIKEIGRGGMASVYLAEVDHSTVNYTLLYAYTQVNGTHSEKVRKANELAKQLEGKIDRTSIMNSLESNNIQMPSKYVALKLAHEGIRNQRIEEEWKYLISLNHPNVIKVYGGGIFNGRPYYIMECVPDIISIKDIIYEFKVEDRIKIIFNAGKGLSFLHKKGIIHRDVKPDNFITYRNKEGRLITKVTDLGLAKNIESSIAFTATENVMGTPYFMSPEQMLSAKNIDQRADIYSLGASLYEFMTGIKPFQDKQSVMDILKTALQKESPISPLNHAKTIPVQLVNIINCSMQFDVNNRYSTMDEFLKDLKMYFDCINEQDVIKFSDDVNNSYICDAKTKTVIDDNTAEYTKNVVVPSIIKKKPSIVAGVASAIVAVFVIATSSLYLVTKSPEVNTKPISKVEDNSFNVIETIVIPKVAETIVIPKVEENKEVVDVEPAKVVVEVKPSIFNSLKTWTEQTKAKEVRDLFYDYDVTSDDLNIKIIKSYETDSTQIQAFTFELAIFNGIPVTIGAVSSCPIEITTKLPCMIFLNSHDNMPINISSMIEMSKAGYYCIYLDVKYASYFNAIQENNILPRSNFNAIKLSWQNCNAVEGSIDSFESPRNNVYFIQLMTIKRAIYLLSNKDNLSINSITINSRSSELVLLSSIIDNRIKYGLCNNLYMEDRTNNYIKTNTSDIKMDNDKFYNIYDAIKNSTATIIISNAVSLEKWGKIYLNNNRVSYDNFIFNITNNDTNKLSWSYDVLKTINNNSFSANIIANICGSNLNPEVTVTLNCDNAVVSAFYISEIDKYWKFLKTNVEKGTWTCDVPIFSTNDSVYVSMLVTYTINDTKFTIGTKITEFISEELKKATIIPLFKNNVIQEDFNDLKDWKVVKSPISYFTSKVQDPIYEAPDNADLCIDVLDQRGGYFIAKFMFPEDKDYVCHVKINPINKWQTITIKLSSLLPGSRQSVIRDFNNWKLYWKLLRSIEILDDVPYIEMTKGGILHLKNGNFDEKRKMRNLRWIQAEKIN